MFETRQHEVVLKRTCLGSPAVDTITENAEDSTTAFVTEDRGQVVT